MGLAAWPGTAAAEHGAGEGTTEGTVAAAGAGAGSAAGAAAGEGDAVLGEAVVVGLEAREGAWGGNCGSNGGVNRCCGLWGC